MEIKININAPGLEKAINNLASALGGSGTTPGNWVPGGGEIKAPIADTPAPAEVPTEAPVTETPVTETATPAITLETVRVKLAELAQAGKQAQVKALITSLGANKLSDVPQDRYAELLEKASGL